MLAKVATPIVSPEAGASRFIRIGTSAVSAAVLVMVVAAAALPWISDSTASGAAAKVVVAALVVGVTPGVLITLAWRPRSELDLLELAAMGAAVSFGLVHLLTVAIILLHGSVQIGSVIMLAAQGCAAGGIWYWSRHRTMLIRVAPDDVIGLALLVLVAACLYAQGSPFNGWEDQIHVSIVRRLAALPRLALDNFYVTPGVVYTYPLPSTHAFMAFVARIGGSDALFVYHKLRFFWSPVALLMIYLGARAIFGRAALATAAMVLGGVLALAGVFAVVEGGYWGQLAVFSHTSDVAMAVLLPSLLAVTYCFVQSDLARERALMALAAIGLVFTLAVVHSREVVQYLVYLGCFTAVAAACAAFRPQAKRAAALLGASALLALVFLAWHNSEVGHVTDQVAGERVKLRTIAASLSPHELFLSSSERVLGSYLIWFDAAFTGITQWLMLALPIVIVAFRQQALVWLIASSTLVYLLVMNIPALSIPYTYLTYHEILNTPIRNLTPFLHMLAGPLLYVIVLSAWAVIREPVIAIAGLAVTGVALGFIALLGPTAANQSEFRFFAPVACAWLGAFLWLDRSGPISALGRTRRLMAVGLAAVSLALLWPEHAPLKPPAPVYVVWRDGLSDTARGAIERQFSLKDGEARPDDGYWTYELADRSRANIRALVQHPSVKDTFHIDRTAFEVEHKPDDWRRYPTAAILVATALGLWATGFVLPWVVARASTLRSADFNRFAEAPFYRYAGPCACLVVPFVFLTLSAQALPLWQLLSEPAGQVPTPSAAIRMHECAITAEVPQHDAVRGTTGPPTTKPCPPAPEVVSWIRANVPVNGVFATNRWNGFLPTTFVPQQVAAFSGLSNEGEIFPAYVRLYRVSMDTHGVQPFFNIVESTQERRTFLKTLGITHVLVDPAYYSELLPVFDGLPEIFSRRYADGRWAVYEVRRGA